MYMIHNDVGAYLIWFTASTTTLHCGLPLGGNKICSNLGIGKDIYKCTFKEYKGCEILYECFTMMWEPI